MTFRDLDEFFDPQLVLPIKGKEYVVESPDAKTGLFVKGLMALAQTAAAGGDIDPDDFQALELDDTQERDLYRRLLGATYDEMLSDGVSWHRVQHAGQTALFWVDRGKPFAERFWNGASDPKERVESDTTTSNEGPPDSPASPTAPETTPSPASPGPTSSSTGP